MAGVAPRRAEPRAAACADAAAPSTGPRLRRHRGSAVASAAPASAAARRTCREPPRFLADGSRAKPPGPRLQQGTWPRAPTGCGLELVTCLFAAASRPAGRRRGPPRACATPWLRARGRRGADAGAPRARRPRRATTASALAGGPAHGARRRGRPRGRAAARRRREAARAARRTTCACAAGPGARGRRCSPETTRTGGHPVRRRGPRASSSSPSRRLATPTRTATPVALDENGTTDHVAPRAPSGRRSASAAARSRGARRLEDEVPPRAGALPPRALAAGDGARRGERRRGARRPPRPTCAAAGGSWRPRRSAARPLVYCRARVFRRGLGPHGGGQRAFLLERGPDDTFDGSPADVDAPRAHRPRALGRGGCEDGRAPTARHTRDVGHRAGRRPGTLPSPCGRARRGCGVCESTDADPSARRTGRRLTPSSARRGPRAAQNRARRVPRRPPPGSGTYAAADAAVSAWF